MLLVSAALWLPREFRETLGLDEEFGKTLSTGGPPVKLCSVSPGPCGGGSPETFGVTGCWELELITPPVTANDQTAPRQPQCSPSLGSPADRLLSTPSCAPRTPPQRAPQLLNRMNKGDEQGCPVKACPPLPFLLRVNASSGPGRRGPTWPAPGSALLHALFLFRDQLRPLRVLLAWPFSCHLMVILHVQLTCSPPKGFPGGMDPVGGLCSKPTCCVVSLGPNNTNMFQKQRCRLVAVPGSVHLSCWNGSPRRAGGHVCCLCTGAQGMQTCKSRHHLASGRSGQAAMQHVRQAPGPAAAQGRGLAPLPFVHAWGEPWDGVTLAERSSCLNFSPISRHDRNGLVEARPTADLPPPRGWVGPLGQGTQHTPAHAHQNCWAGLGWAGHYL